MLKSAPLMTDLPIVNVEKEKDFYTEKLNLKVKKVPDGLIVECGNGTMLHLYKRDKPSTADHTIASFLVNNIEKAIQELNNKGIVFEQYDMPNIQTDVRGIAKMDGMKVAWFKDPEGNILALSEQEEE